MAVPVIRFADFADVNPKVTLSKGELYPFVSMDALTPGERYVGSTTRRAFDGGGARFASGDVLFARITPCLENGKIAQFVSSTQREGFGSTEFLVFRPKKGISEGSYLFYLALSSILREPAEKSMSGASGRQRADLNVVKDLLVPAPDIPTQRRVGAILSAYDDLIANNARRIAILEEMARALYREWFVHFRFPGHERVPMVESALGLVPDGWEVRAFSDAVDINPTTRVPKEGEKPFVPMGSLSETSMLIDNIESRTGNSGSKFMNGDTLFARITPCLENGKTGFVQFLPTDGAVAFGSTEFIVMRSRSVCPEYVYLTARSESFRDNAIKSMTGATGRQRVQEACFDRFLIAQPDSAALSIFVEHVRPLFQAIFLLATKNNNLRRTRDLLLPRLVAGDIAVEDIDITCCTPGQDIPVS
jgi:type I restriction enzyme S subunit